MSKYSDDQLSSRVQLSSQNQAHSMDLEHIQQNLLFFQRKAYELLHQSDINKNDKASDTDKTKKNRRKKQNEILPGLGRQCLTRNFLQFAKLVCFKHILRLQGEKFIQQNKKLRAIFFTHSGQYKKSSRLDEYPHIFKGSYTYKNIWNDFFDNEVLQKSLKASKKCPAQNKKIYGLFLYRFKQVKNLESSNTLLIPQEFGLKINECLNFLMPYFLREYFGHISSYIFCLSEQNKSLNHFFNQIYLSFKEYQSIKLNFSFQSFYHHLRLYFINPSFYCFSIVTLNNSHLIFLWTSDDKLYNIIYKTTSIIAMNCPFNMFFILSRI